MTYIQQGWNARSINIRIQHSCGRAFSGSGEGEIYSDGAFADTALGTADGDYFVHVWNGPFLGKAWKDR